MKQQVNDDSNFRVYSEKYNGCTIVQAWKKLKSY